MRLNEFVNGFFEVSEDRKINNSRLVRKDLCQAYQMLDDVRLARGMTPEKARVFYEIYLGGYKSGKNGEFKAIMDILKSM